MCVWKKQFRASETLGHGTLSGTTNDSRFYWGMHNVYHVLSSKYKNRAAGSVHASPAGSPIGWPGSA